MLASKSQKKPQQHGYVWAALGLALLALCARLIEATFSLDGDEIFSVLVVRDGFDDTITRSLADKPHPPLHNILLHVWIQIFGASEMSVRSMSALFSAGTVFIFFTLLRTQVRMSVAAGASLVIVASGFLFFYGQQARPYALVSLLGAFNVWAFFRLLDDPDRRGHIAFWAISGVMLVFAQYFGAVYLFIEGCILLVVHRWRALKGLIPAAAISTTIFIWMYAAFRSGQSLTEIQWIEKPYLRSLPDFFVGTIGWPQWVHGLILLALVGALSVAGGFRLLNEPRSERARSFFVLLVLAFVPPALAFGLSYVLTFSVWAPRQLMISALTYIAVLAFCVDTLPRSLRLMATLLLIAWALAGSGDGLPSHSRVPWRSITEQIERAHSNAVVFGQEWFTAGPLHYYAKSSRVKNLKSDRAEADGTQAVYFVCRPLRCDQLGMLSDRFGAAVEQRRDKWNYVGGKPQNEMITYRLGN